MRVAFAVPGALETRTGGYAYDRAVIEGLRERGHEVSVLRLADRFPSPTPEDLDHAAASLLALPAGTPTVIDGLAFGVLDPIAELLSRHLHLVALVHHPLALETGVSAERRAELFRRERAALALASRVAATSATTARTLREHFDTDEVVVLPPGTPRPERRPRPRVARGTVRLLCVATLTPRKGQHVLLEALPDRGFSLDLVGAPRDPAYAERIRRMAEGRPVRIHGEVDEETLDGAYREADAFVLPSFHEGYGMSAAEALAYGLPVVTTRAGALPEVVPEDAGLFVEPGDVAGLREALLRLPDELEERSRAAARAPLPRSTDTVAGWDALLRSFR